MPVLSPSFQIKSLYKSQNREEYKLYIAGLEWNLIDPIVIKNDEDLHSKYNWKDKVEPYHHQVKNLLTFCRRLPVTLLSDDVGLGKTISAGLIASELMERNYVTKILVVCPKLLMPQWKEELDCKFGIKSVEAIGQELLSVNPPGEIGAVITTYHSARLYLKEISNAGFQMLILDEAHKLRNLYGTPDPPQVARSFQKALASRLFKYVLMLTATPIQNRLWDIYSLVDLLTVARGHENPFGSPGMFARNFIADSRSEARELKLEMKDEFRSIVYGYMSRTRRGDANLQFPEREVQLHRVEPTKEELELINTLAEPIQYFNRLMQISILQALVSSPHALSAQLENSARKGTVPESLAISVRAIVKKMKTSAKLTGLYSLIKQLQYEQGKNFRMVIFTERRETQTTIEAFLRENEISCGLINGDSGAENQETISRFKKTPPEVQVIVSTRAGSEGVNLQAANILINYDLPWNPMIVEQRIGRVQRLNSNHAKVCIFNIVLKNTFEEYIVGRLMEKLQMATHAIGDIEALLEATGIEEDDATKGFEEKIRELVIQSLKGNDVERHIKLTEESITQAKIELEREEKNINDMLGDVENNIDLGPRPPDFPVIERSMSESEFSIEALKNLGANVTKQGNDFLVNIDGQSNLITFGNSENSNRRIILCKSGTPFFEKLVTRIINAPKHLVDDIESNWDNLNKEIINDWLCKFNATYENYKINRIRRCFIGSATLRIRITVTHDSYERLLHIKCDSKGELNTDNKLLDPLESIIENPMTLGLSQEYLKQMAIQDIGVSEFCRFYLERLEEEIKKVGNDPIKLIKIENDFTPNIEISIVGLEGIMFREFDLKVNYSIEANNYENSLIICPTTKNIEETEMKLCEYKNILYPSNCLSKCEISKKNILKHILFKSDLSGRLALPEYRVVCSLTGKKVLIDEVEKSDVTNKEVISGLMKTSSLSGKKGEPEHFVECEFSKTEILKNESAISQVSGKRYRVDQESRSSISSKAGHNQEFVFCSETGKPLLIEEAEKCEKTNKIVSPGILEKCEVSGKKVLPNELEKSAVSGKKALKEYFVTSNISNSLLLRQEAIRSSKGNFCTFEESKKCTWSGKQNHPEDLQNCSITNLLFNFEYIVNGRFKILYLLLAGTQVKLEKVDLWDSIIKILAHILENKNLRIISAELSLDQKNLAVTFEIKSWVGLKVRYGGIVYSLESQNIISSIKIGKRKDNNWHADE